MFNRHILDLFSKLSRKKVFPTNIETIQDLSLFEIFEIGWFLRRFLFELPHERKDISEFQNRIDKVILISQKFNILDDEVLHAILSIRNAGFFRHGIGKKQMVDGREIFSSVEISLAKNLKEKENAKGKIY